jgi:hypothetical protein
MKAGFSLVIAIDPVRGWSDNVAQLAQQEPESAHLTSIVVSIGCNGCDGGAFAMESHIWLLWIVQNVCRRLIFFGSYGMEPWRLVTQRCHNQDERAEPQ